MWDRHRDAIMSKLRMWVIPPKAVKLFEKIGRDTATNSGSKESERSYFPLNPISSGF